MRILAEREARHAFSDPALPPVLVYQMGKVGSSSVYDSLLNADLRNPVLHLHFLSEDLIQYREELKRAGWSPLPYHIYLGEAVRKVLPRHCRIISLVRDPIAFVVSNLFENPYVATGMPLTRRKTLDAKKALGYLERELAGPDAFTYVNTWFERELHRVFGIDVFGEPFPKELGYAIYGSASAKALVLRLEDLSREGPKAIASFLDLPAPLELRHSRVATESESAEEYRDVLSNVCLDASLCRQVYSSRLVTHFYDETSIEGFISKWTRDGLDRDCWSVDRSQPIAV